LAIAQARYVLPTPVGPVMSTLRCAVTHAVQQGQSGKAGQIGLVCQSSGLFIGVRFLRTERSQTW